MSDNYMVIPEGDVVFMALAKPIKKYPKKAAKALAEGKPDKEYTCRVCVDGRTAEGKATVKALNAINKKLVVTESENVNIPDGHFLVRASTDYPPTVVDYNKEEIEEVPFFNKGSTCKATLVVKPFKGSEEGEGGIKLITVALGEGEFTEQGPSEAALALDEALKNVNK